MVTPVGWGPGREEDLLEAAAVAVSPRGVQNHLSLVRAMKTLGPSHMRPDLSPASEHFWELTWSCVEQLYVTCGCILLGPNPCDHL